MFDLYAERIRTARKIHRCIGCQTDIAAGERYLCIATTYDDGTPVSLAYHSDCRAWEVFLCQENDLLADEWSELHEHVSGIM